MDKLIYTAMSGAKATMGQQAAVAHNLANATTNGFRAELHKFRSVPVQSPALATRAFVVDASVASDMKPGPMIQTGSPFDMAVHGSGWFVVQGADGKDAYTRNGAFTVDANGVLRTANGLAVQGDGGEITVPEGTRIEVGSDGSISATPTTGNATTGSVIGRLKLVNPPEADLRRGEDGLFRTASGTPAAQDDSVRVHGGFIEGSNVNVVEQMVTMLSLARHFEMNTKLLETAKEDDRVATAILAR
ncbi:flagellar basal-body rod protein FlgF [Viridibacterium curvum]|uniref:Flagellar basal-body rod protein FlgF n=1 Tax=Viridibacterium curvum TaxID=1101404 RepID=A0ABP9Q7C6_9RHOO